MAVTQESLIRHIVDHYKVAPEEIDAHTPLLSSGLLDSFDVVALVTFIETDAHIRVAGDEITLDNLDSIARILAYIEGKA